GQPPARVSSQPMMGLIPAAVQACTKRTAPLKLSWSVRARAGISRSAACCTSSSMALAPSRKEKGEWTCRCTKPSVIHPVQPPLIRSSIPVQLKQPSVGRLHPVKAPFPLAGPPAAQVRPLVDDAGDPVNAVLPAKARQPALGQRDVDGGIDQAHGPSLPIPVKAVHGLVVGHCLPGAARAAGRAAGCYAGGVLPRAAEGVPVAGADGGQGRVVPGAVGALGIPKQRLPPLAAGG